MKNPFIAAPSEKVSVVRMALNYALVIVLVVLLFWLSFVMAGVALDFSFVWQYRQRLLDGFVMTMELSVASLALSLVIGIPVALAQGCRLLFLRFLCDLYVKLIRGTPLLAQIYLFYYIVGTAWGIDNRMLAGVLILSIFSGAHIAEIVRGSLSSLDQGQIEAAHSCGFTRAQTARYIVVPQLISQTLPALTGQFAAIVKDSSLLSVIAVIELTQTIREITATNFNLFGGYIFLAALYLCLTLPIMFVSKFFEKRLAYAH